MSLEFGEGHFYGVEIGAVGRQEQEPSPAFLEDCRSLLAFVAGEIVEDDHVAGLECRRKLGLDVNLEDAPVHRAVDHPGRCQPVMAQGGDKGLGSPVAERGLHLEALSFASTSSQSRHLGRRTGLVDKDEPFRAPLHPRLAVHSPHPPGANDVSAIGFAGQQRFF